MISLYVSKKLTLNQNQFYIKMESVFPLRHRAKASNLLHMATTKLPVLWITDYVHHMRSQIPIEEAVYLWDDLYKMKIETLTDTDRQFLAFLKDIVMDWVVEHHYMDTLVDFYFYNYLLLHFKCIPFSIWMEDEKIFLMNYLDEQSNQNTNPILKRMNLEMQQLCK